VRPLSFRLLTASFTLATPVLAQSGAPTPTPGVPSALAPAPAPAPAPPYTQPPYAQPPNARQPNAQPPYLAPVPPPVEERRWPRVKRLYLDLPAIDVHENLVLGFWPSMRQSLAITKDVYDLLHTGLALLSHISMVA
jgi:hypothetical protein